MIHYVELGEEYKSRVDSFLDIKKDFAGNMVVYDGDKPIKTEPIPEDLRRSFEILPNKRGLVVIKEFTEEKETEHGKEKIKYEKVLLGIIRIVDIHRHSEFSLLDGGSRIKDIVKATELVGAISDHGVMFGTLEYYKQMKKAGKKPIIGFEGYLETLDGDKKGNHISIFFKNKKGYENGCKIISFAEENFYKKPHISYEILEKYSEGLICCSACLGGEIPELLSKMNYDKALEVAENLQSIFGEDFYLEIQRHNIEEEKTVNPMLIDLAAETGIKLVATIDSHYVSKEDSFAHEVLLAIGTKGKLSDEKRYKFEGDGYHIHSAEEFEELFHDIPEAIYNLYEIAEKCQFEFELGNIYMPEFPIPASYKNATEYFEHLCWEGFKDRFEGTPKDNEEYRERLSFEMNVITNMKYEGYFLIVWDFIKYARDNGIMVGPGRGSAVGSLVSYCLKITNLDPIPYGLLFERFLNPERVSMPDIDIDFEDTRREEVIDYVKRKYGEDRVSRIITFGTMAARSVVRDVGRVLEKDYALVDKVAKAIPATPKITIKKAFDESPEFKDMYDKDPQVKEIVDIALKLEGLSRHKSQHACGVVIASKPINCFVPEVLLEDKHNKGQKTRTAAFNMTELEELGLLKMDFLGLRNMYILGESVKLINQRHKLSIDPDDIPLNDPYVYKFIGTGNTSGIFQIESGGMQSLMKQMFADVSSKIASIEKKFNCRGFSNVEYFGKAKMTNEELFTKKLHYKKAMEEFGNELFERLIAAISLYRPGPMDYIPDYIEGMNNPEKIHYDTPELEPILSRTYGVIVYQEQVQQIVRELAGYSLGRGDLIRRAMGKKKKDIMNAEKEIFLNGNEESYRAKKDKNKVDGCINRGIDLKVAEIIWNKMEKFAEYAFNKSHSAGYAVISIQTAWLKTYYPTEFFTVTLNSIIDKSDKLKFYLAETKKMGIDLLGPSVNKSERFFSIEEDAIRVGLMGLRNLGKMSEPIIEERNKNGEFKSLETFVDRMISSINKKMLESLIYSGAFDCFKGNRNSKIEAVPTILNLIKDMKKATFSEMWFSLEELDKAYADFKAIQIPEIEDFDKKTKLEKEFEFVGLYASEHPLDDFVMKLDSIGTLETVDILPEEDSDEVETSDKTSPYEGQYIKLAGIIRESRSIPTKNGPMYVFKLEDKSGSIGCVIFSSNTEDNKDQIIDGNLVVIDGKVQTNNFGTQVIANAINELEKLKTDKAKKIFIKIRDDRGFADVKSIIKESSGTIPVIVVLDGKGYRAEKGIKLDMTMFLKLRKIFGKDIKIKY